MSPGGFYREAIEAWSKITPRLTGGSGKLGSDLVFHNPQITDETGSPLIPIPWMAKRGLFRLGQVRGFSGVGLKRAQWEELVELRGKIPSLPLADEARYILSTPAGRQPFLFPFIHQVNLKPFLIGCSNLMPPNRGPLYLHIF